MHTLKIGEEVLDLSSWKWFDYDLRFVSTSYLAENFVICVPAYIFRKQLLFSDKSSKTGEKLESLQLLA